MSLSIRPLIELKLMLHKSASGEYGNQPLFSF